jgi:hypothetical protein
VSLALNPLKKSPRPHLAGVLPTAHPTGVLPAIRAPRGDPELRPCTAGDPEPRLRIGGYP